MPLKPASGTPINTSDSLESGLILYWALLEGSGSIANDSSVSVDHGTFGTNFIGPPTWSTDANGDPILVFNSGGAANYILNGVTRNPPQVTLAIEARVRSTLPGAKSLFAGFANGDGGGTNDKDLYLNASNIAEFYVFDGGVKTVTDVAALNADQWYQLVATADGSNIRLYRDGTQQAITAAGNTFTGQSVPDILLGGRDSVSTYLGIDVRWFAVWDRAVTPTEVSRLFSTPYPLFVASFLSASASDAMNVRDTRRQLG